MTTNGTREGADTTSVARTEETSSSLNGQSVEERLEALRQTIRTWDWRAGVVEVRPSATEVAATTGPPLTTTFTEIHADPESLVGDPSPLQGVEDTQPIVDDATPRSIGVASSTGAITPPVVAVAPSTGTLAPSTREFDPPLEVAPLLEYPSPDGTLGDEVGVDGTLWLGQEPEPQPKSEPDGRLLRLWSHRMTKLAVLALAALVVVALIIGGIRLFAKNPGSPGPSATTVTRPASRSVHHNHFVAPISAAQLTRYQKFALDLHNANLAAISGFEKAGSTPTPAQVAPVVEAYRTAVNNYDFQLHLIQWPQSMQSAIEADYAQLQALAGFLQAFALVPPNGVPRWLSQVHNRTGTTQAADNVVRQDLGLPASFSFP